MMLSEFVERTGFEPMPAEYAKIEEAYCSFNGDKDASGIDNRPAPEVTRAERETDG